MTIHVNIGAAKTRLSELLAAAKRGEEVVITRAGEPEARLVPVDPDRHRSRVAEARMKWIGRRDGQLTEEALDFVAEPTFTPEEMAEFGAFPDEKDET